MGSDAKGDGVRANEEAHIIHVEVKAKVDNAFTGSKGSVVVYGHWGFGVGVQANSGSAYESVSDSGSLNITFFGR